MKKETIEQVYNELEKSLSADYDAVPCRFESYILYDKNKKRYDISRLFVDMRSKETALEILTRCQEQPNFYAFVHEKRGYDFIQENADALNKCMLGLMKAFASATFS